MKRKQMRDAAGVKFCPIDLFGIVCHVLTFLFSYLWLKWFIYVPLSLSLENRYSTEGCGYFYEIDARINDMSRLMEGQVSYVIDATNYGNVSRYINHRWGQEDVLNNFCRSPHILYRPFLVYCLIREWGLHKILNYNVSKKRLNAESCDFVEAMYQLKSLCTCFTTQSNYYSLKCKVFAK